MGDIMLQEQLKKESVRIKDLSRVTEIVHQMAKAGPSRLQVAADFDFTLSRFRDDNGEPCHSCHRAFERSTRLPNHYRDGAKQLLQHYYPIEVDSSLTIEQKTPLMIEWWTKSHELMVSCNINKDIIPDIVRESHILFRKGCDWMFNLLSELSVPVLIFSAGIGDIIHESLKQRSALYNNMKIISNFMDFNNQGMLTGFKGELLHVFNKNEHSVQSSGYFSDMGRRDCILLLGDSLGDLRMADGAVSCHHILRIGFLNDKIEERMNDYLDQFDIVLVNDHTMDVPNAVLKYISEYRVQDNGNAS